MNGEIAESSNAEQPASSKEQAETRWEKVEHENSMALLWWSLALLRIRKS